MERANRLSDPIGHAILCHNRMLFTTSWDDGYTYDLRMASILEKHGLTGTFYVSPAVQKGTNPMLSDAEISSLGQRHEIGAHTITHPHLPTLSPEQALQEMVASKQWIEERTGKPCAMFCYPYGDENASIRALAKQAGFAGARGIKLLQTDAGNDPFALPTTLPAYPVLRRRWKKWWHPLDPFGWVRMEWRQLNRVGVPILERRNWPTLARRLFDDARRTNQPVFHLWGHTNGVERNNLWEAIDGFLAYVSASGDIQPGPNSAMLPLVSPRS